MIKIKVFSVYHKNWRIYKDSIFQPIQVGAACADHLLPGMLYDNTGENISSKNPNYCELTALYWIWKNLPDDVSYVGLNHYRRFLQLPSIFCPATPLIALYRFLRTFELHGILRKLNWLELLQIPHDEDMYFKRLERLSRKLQSGPPDFDILLPHKEFLPVSVYQQYKEIHRENDLRLLMMIVREKFPVIFPHFKKSLEQMAVYPANLFVMRRDIFEEYMAFVFEILFTLEKQVQIPDDPYQRRIFGFLSERLMRPFIEYKKCLSRQLKIRHGFIYFLRPG